MMRHSHWFGSPLTRWFDMESCLFYICTELGINPLNRLADIAWRALWVLRPWEHLSLSMLKGAIYDRRIWGSLLYPLCGSSMESTAELFVSLKNGFPRYSKWDILLPCFFNYRLITLLVLLVVIVRTWEHLSQLMLKGAIHDGRNLGPLLYPVP